MNRLKPINSHIRPELLEMIKTCTVAEWHMLAALRGPDKHLPLLKSFTTAPIRYEAGLPFTNHYAAVYSPIEAVSIYAEPRWPHREELLLEYSAAPSHFLDHVADAMHDVGLGWYWSWFEGEMQRDATT